MSEASDLLNPNFFRSLVKYVLPGMVAVSPAATCLFVHFSDELKAVPAPYSYAIIAAVVASVFILGITSEILGSNLEDHLFCEVFQPNSQPQCEPDTQAKANSRDSHWMGKLLFCPCCCGRSAGTKKTPEHRTDCKHSNARPLCRALRGLLCLPPTCNCPLPQFPTRELAYDTWYKYLLRPSSPQLIADRYISNFVNTLKFETAMTAALCVFAWTAVLSLAVHLGLKCYADGWTFSFPWTGWLFIFCAFASSSFASLLVYLAVQSIQELHRIRSSILEDAARTRDATQRSTQKASATDLSDTTCEATS